MITRLGLKRFLGLPIYKRDIIRHAMKYRHEFGICFAFKCALLDADLGTLHWKSLKSNYRNIFPLFTPTLAGRPDAKEGEHWWTPGDWESGRMEFLQWLYRQYKHDWTNLKNLNF